MSPDMRDHLDDYLFHEPDVREPGEYRPGERVPMPPEKVYPFSYWAKCDELKKRAHGICNAVRIEICIKRHGPMFAVVATTPGMPPIEGPARGDRIEAWEAFLGLAQ